MQEEPDSMVHLKLHPSQWHRKHSSPRNPGKPSATNIKIQLADPLSKNAASFHSLHIRFLPTL
jgi:hypothetical protein